MGKLSLLFLEGKKNKVRESIYLIVITPILKPLFTVPSITRLTMIVVMWWMKLKMKKPCDGNFFHMDHLQTQ